MHWPQQVAAVFVLDGSHIHVRSTLTKAFTFIAGVAFALNLSTGTATAAPAEEAAAKSNPSQAKFECSDSHHSNTGHGANNDGGYQSTCDPDDFGGNGQESGPGKQTGKPCAGCVGNADDKNPPGQYPDGSDHNSGYECDGRDRPSENQNGNGNHGIGDENPAHTGCDSTEPELPEIPLCPDGTPMTDTDGNGQINAADCNKVDDEDEPTPPAPVVVTKTTDVVTQPAVASITELPVVAAAVSVSAPVSVAPATTAGAEVLGVQIERPAALAATGMTPTWVFSAVVLLLLGGFLVAATRERHAA